MSKILLTGGTGYIGLKVLNALIDREDSVTLLIRPSTNTSDLPMQCSTFIYDGNCESLYTFFDEERFDGVLHLASLSKIRVHKTKDIEALISSNIILSTVLLDISTKTKVKWFLNVGTFWQHFDNEKYSPVNLYAATKESFITIAKYYVDTSSIRFNTLMLNDTYGQDDSRSKIFNLWFNLLISHEILKMSPGEQIIDLCYIDDVVNAFLIMVKLLESKENCIDSMERFAVYSSERMTLREMAQKFESIVGRSLPIAWGAVPYRNRDVMIPQNHIRGVPGWVARVSFEEGIKRIIKKNMEK
ncbi:MULTISPECIES: NAD(P)-dependent oxidoreductase [unclassified Oceanispirochaeta]|uniref:NAD-dependent epimerase/dehydratase family protein n=1 Tax=unclassified Oceanispirochaeta TaxID=2635722 RepID=UPI000E097462|nr:MULTISPECIES: NAD(P)-dependent oxidoreductase [unclassified Oceanispirochaeta]MBF9018669.1 NAD(P)-dependent oxidoreductase [Oceanispirochaeta sp. M2]NPD75106.1 NAD(P)-dependent oxidoreductase [Oceanispirochaeta sp. M1]RDG29031.1 NAD(P)-dependent oxidoreductase [Oceanispirochaeta sp. M1]